MFAKIREVDKMSVCLDPAETCCRQEMRRQIDLPIAIKTALSRFYGKKPIELSCVLEIEGYPARINPHLTVFQH